MALANNMLTEKNTAFLFIIVKLPTIAPTLVPGPVIINASIAQQISPEGVPFKLKNNMNLLGYHILRPTNSRIYSA